MRPLRARRNYYSALARGRERRILVAARAESLLGRHRDTRTVGGLERFERLPREWVRRLVRV